MNDDRLAIADDIGREALAELEETADYLCAFGPRWCSAETAARVLFGEAEAAGSSPVSVPGTDILAG